MCDTSWARFSLSNELPESNYLELEPIRLIFFLPFCHFRKGSAEKCKHYPNECGLCLIKLLFSCGGGRIGRN